MATQDEKDTTTRRIVGSIIKGGRIYKAGDEDVLFGALSEADRNRLATSGQLTGDWSGAEPSKPASEDDETDEDEVEGLPPLSGMAEHLAGIETADEVKALRKTDKRKGAKQHYASRLAEIAAAEKE